MVRPTRDDFEFMAGAAKAAAANATALAIEADLLFRNGHHARALALAVASLEEDGKHTLILRQATEFDPDFRNTIGKASHDIRKHRVKQTEALKSIARIFDTSAAQAIIGLVVPGAGLWAAVEEVADEMYKLRETALYADIEGDRARTPDEVIPPGVAQKYLRLALTQAATRTWMLGTLVVFLERYRTLWLEHTSRPGYGEDLPVTLQAAEEMLLDILANFDFSTNEKGLPAAMRRKEE